MYNNYTDPVLLETPPEKVKIDAVTRNILSDKPRITRFEIDWGEKQEMTIENEAPTSMEVLTSNQVVQSSNPYQDLAMEADYSKSMQTANENDIMRDDSNNPFLSN